MTQKSGENNRMFLKCLVCNEKVCIAELINSVWVANLEKIELSKYFIDHIHLNHFDDNSKIQIFFNNHAHFVFEYDENYTKSLIELTQLMLSDYLKDQ